MSMTKSVARARRILALQEQLHRIERWKLLELQGRLAELDTLRQDLIAALNHDDALQGLFLDATARRLTSIAREADEIGQQEQLQSVQVAEQAIRLVCAERLHEAARDDAQRAGERQALLDVIDRLVGSATQASRKIAQP
jgi:hypothetical protein